MIKHVILDSGGVICMSRMAHPTDWFTPVRFEEVIGPERLNSVSPELLEKCKAAAAKIYLDESMPIPDETYEFVVRRNYIMDVAKRCAWVLTDQEADTLARDFTENDARYAFFDDSREGVRMLSEKYSLGLLSDAMPSMKRVLDNAGYLELFDAAVLSCDIGATKPDKKMYQAITGMLEAEPDECVFVDDRTVNLVGAEEFGIHAIHMARNGETDWPGVRAKDLFEVMRIIEEGKF